MHRRPLALLVLVPLALAPARLRADVIMPRGDTLVHRLSDGTETQILPRILIAARKKTDRAQAEIPQLVTRGIAGFRPEASGLLGEAAVEGVTTELRVGWEAGSGFTLSLSARPGAATWVRLIALELDIDADHAILFGRDLRPQALGALAVLGRLDPKWVTLYRRGRAVMTLAPDDSFDGLWVRRLSPSRLRLRLDLLSVDARPFLHFASCTENWKDPNQRLLLPMRLVLAGEKLAAQAGLYRDAVTPLMKGRYPDGRRAALVITDHADQTAAATLRTISGGTSDMNDPSWGQKGLLGHGIAITKALWLRSGDRATDPGGQALPERLDGPAPASLSPALPASPDEAERQLLQEFGLGQADESGGGRPQLDDPQVVQLVDRLHAAGWEVVPHSATPHRDTREQTEAALQYFRRYGARSWIDHQPYTNCEALVNQGYRPGKYGIGDLLSEHGYRYAWSGLDVAPSPELNLLMPRQIDRYVPVIWPVGRLSGAAPGQLWLFRSMLAFVETARFFEMYSVEALDRLERERGLHISHTYLENFHPTKTWFGKRNLLVPGKRPREVVLDPRLDALLSALAARIARGTLWVPTIARLGDHLRAMESARMTLMPDGSAAVRSEMPILGATFVVPRPAMQVRVDGRAPRGVRGGDGETVFWLDLPPGRTLNIRLYTQKGEPMSFLDPPAWGPSRLAP